MGATVLSSDHNLLLRHQNRIIFGRSNGSDPMARMYRNPFWLEVRGPYITRVVIMYWKRQQLDLYTLKPKKLDFLRFVYLIKLTNGSLTKRNSRFTRIRTSSKSTVFFFSMTNLSVFFSFQNTSHSQLKLKLKLKKFKTPTTNFQSKKN